MVTIVFRGGGRLPHTTGIVWPISHQISHISPNRTLSARILMTKVSAYGGVPLPAEAFWDDLVIKICFITPGQGFPPCITTRCPSGRDEGLRILPCPGRGDPLPGPPPPMRDVHHGPLPGAIPECRLFSCVWPLALPHERFMGKYELQWSTPPPLHPAHRPLLGSARGSAS